MQTQEFKKLDLNGTFKILNSNPSGLTNQDAVARVEKHGYNEIIEKKKSRLLKFAAYFWGPIPWMIETAAVLSILLQHWDDLAIILSLLIINGVIGFWQEDKADTAVEMLKKKLALTARVFRNGSWIVLPSRELVPGDVVRIRLGDIIPADIKLINGDYALIDESALTGESLPVEKHVSDIGYSGSIVKQGEMDAVVVTTGGDTFFGKTTKLVQEAKTRSHFQKAVIKIGNFLIILAVVMVSIVFIVSILRGQSLLETLQFSLILVVASIPVAMPAVLSVTMAVGALTLAKKEAIVTKLESIEEMAGVDILCADKTGTITKNQITVAEIKTFSNFSENDALSFAVLSSRKEDQDPIETAIFQKASENKIDVSNYEVISYKPFDPTSKRTEATVSDKNRKLFLTKGAPQIVLSLVKNKSVSAEVEDTVEVFASKGYRSLAVAEGEAGKELKLVALIALYDPPREDSKETISMAREMGVNVKMITGDHVAIAREICKEVGIGDKVIQAASLQNISNQESEIEEADAFSELFPEHKYQIVETLQNKGHIVGMTGDGVNDAPALKKADAGIAVSGATDAARSAADIVLTSSGLSVIIDAIKQSRMIFKRMNSYAIYRIAETIRVLIFLAFSIIIFNIYPITAVMLVVLALLNDIPIMMIAYDNARAKGKPASWKMRRVLILSSILGLIGVISSFLLLVVGIEVFHLDFSVLQSFIFLKLAVAGHLTIYLTRTEDKPFWTKPFPSLKLFSTLEATQIIATIIVVLGLLMTPLSLDLVLFVWVYALAFFFVTDLLKVKISKMIGLYEND